MTKLTRPRWTTIRIRAFGCRIGVRLNTSDAEVIERIAARLPPGWEPSPPLLADVLYTLRIAGSGRQRKLHELHNPERRVVSAKDLELVLDALENEMQMFVGEHARERIFVHAGVVGWKGRALVLPGRSMAGKSTLVAALLARGATYFSDEYAVFDADGLVHPYARRLSLRQPEGPPRRCTAADVGSESAGGPCPVGTVALVRYDPAATWRPHRLSNGAAVLELARHTLSMLDRPHDALAALQQAVRRAQSVKGLRGDAQETAAALLAAMDD